MTIFKTFFHQTKFPEHFLQHYTLAQFVSCKTVEFGRIHPNTVLVCLYSVLGTAPRLPHFGSYFVAHLSVIAVSSLKNCTKKGKPTGILFKLNTVYM